MSPEIIDSGPLTEIFAIYGRVARKLAPESKVSVEEMEQTHPPLPAFEQYIKGLLVHAPASKISFLSQALRIEPTFHRVRIELWNAYTDLSEHQQALAAVRDVPTAHRLARQARFLGAISMLNLAQYQPASAALSELNVSRGKSHSAGALRGAMWGAGLGLGVGLMFAAVPNSERHSQSGYGLGPPTAEEGILLGCGGGLVIGLSLGGLAGTERWDSVRIPASIAVVPVGRRLGLRFALNR
jgi:hypothetical protein